MYEKLMKYITQTDYVNLLGRNVNVTKNNAANVMEVSKTFGLEMKVERAKYMLMSLHSNVGNEDGKLLNSVAKFKCIGITVTYQNET